MISQDSLQPLIEEVWANRELLTSISHTEAIQSTIEGLDKGIIRVAEQTPEGWIVNEWIKKAVLLY
ncbi:MAG: 2,3,4,5-tetrahydropyridine-2,6-dicarboxylate N-succinyltransferase, partial [Bacteroidales bacterium]|nr:2,3,4,5-tetrahydropyridine-2,6-dicarboxylate N-succinyltransferase [Candidatus Colimorpha onthohippi]